MATTALGGMAHSADFAIGAGVCIAQGTVKALLAVLLAAVVALVMALPLAYCGCPVQPGLRDEGGRLRLLRLGRQRLACGPELQRAGLGWCLAPVGDRRQMSRLQDQDGPTHVRAVHPPLAGARQPAAAGPRRLRSGAPSTTTTITHDQCRETRSRAAEHILNT